MRVFAQALATLLVLLPAPGLAGERSLRFAIVVGNNVGLSDEEPLRYAESEAFELYKVLVELGDVSPSHAYLALGKTGPELTAILREVESRISEAGSPAEALLLFFYSGHAGNGALHQGGTTFPLAELKSRLQATRARTVIALLDACRSGAIVRQKGLVVEAPFELRMEPSPASGLVLITSSGPAEASLESEDLQGSFFSHALLSGLRGDADLDQDRRISLNEIYQYAYHRTVSATAGTRVGTQHPAYDFDLRGAGEIILTWPAKSEAALTLGADLEGEYLVMTRASRRVVAEIAKAAGAPKTIALPAQGYLVKKRVAGGYLVGEINLAWGGEKPLDEAALEFVSFEAVAAKGALPPLRPNAWMLGAVIRNSVIPGNDPLPGAQLGYRRRLSEAFTIGAALSYTSGATATQDGPVPTHGLDLEVEGLFVQSVGNLQLFGGGGLGALVYWQEIPAWRDSWSTGFSASGQIGATWLLRDPLELGLAFRGGLDLLKRDGAFRPTPRLELVAGLGSRF